MTPEMIAERLGQTGLCICPDYISRQTVKETRADFDLIRKKGELHRAGIGRGVGRQIEGKVRRDETHWLDRTVGNVVQSALLEKLDAIKLALNQTLYLGLGDMEGHYATYPKGGFYRRHLDCFRNSNSRIVSVVLYLNQNWKTADGGQLRIFGKDNSHTDVVPVGGTMVCFLSQESEHEVLACYRRRFSFAGWFKRFGQV